MGYYAILCILFIGIFITTWVKFLKRGPVYKSDISLAGKTVLITGGSRGLGKAVATELAKRHARVVIASRGAFLGAHAVNAIKSETLNNNVDYMRLDLSDLDDVRRFVRHFLVRESRLDILVNNASRLSAERTENGQHGSMFATNLLGPFLLTQLLLPLLKKTASENPTRIINVTCKPVGGFEELNLDDLDPHLEEEDVGSIHSCYRSTKLLIIHFTAELSRRLKNNVTAYLVHPGVLNSDLDDPSLENRGSYAMRLLISVVTRSPYYGAQPVLFCCLHPGIEGSSGVYLTGPTHFELSSYEDDPTISRRVWRRLETVCSGRTECRPRRRKRR